jgi:hypothetical protein
MKTADSGNPSSWNRYAYVGGDPVNLNDPTGMIACDTDYDGCDVDTQEAEQLCDEGNDAYCTDDGGGIVFSTTVTGLNLIEPLTLPNLSTLTSLVINTINEIASTSVSVGSNALGAVILIFTPTATSATDTLHQTIGVPTVQELQGTCVLIDTVIVPSTNNRNKGGTSVEEVYQCPDGSIWTVHTLKNKNGGIFQTPHIRQGPPRHGGSNK